MTQPEPQQPEKKPAAMDCQDCNRTLSLPLVSGFVKKVEGKLYIAALCPDCGVKRMGLEWRLMERPSIVVPGQQQRPL